MPIKKEKIKAWSYSRWSVWKLCPFKAYLKFILKMQEPTNQWMEDGKRKHTLAEYYVDGTKSRLPKELVHYKDQFKSARRKFKKGYAFVERELAFTKTWEPTGWFDRDCWLRVSPDLEIDSRDTYEIVDHKSGKPYGEGYESQLDLSAAAVSIMVPKVATIVVSNWYLDHALEPATLNYSQKQCATARKQWAKRVKPMLNDTTYTPRKNQKCKYCHFRKANGGPCKY